MEGGLFMSQYNLEVDILKNYVWGFPMPRNSHSSFLVLLSFPAECLKCPCLLSSASNALTPERGHGSLIGYSESNHKLLQQQGEQQLYDHHHHNHHPHHGQVKSSSHQLIDVTRQKHPRAMEYQGGFLFKG